MDRLAALISTLVAGGLVALQPPANSSLAAHVGDLGAALVSLLISTAIVAVLLVTVGDAGRLSGIGGFRPEHLLGGISGAAVVTISLITVRSLGVGGVIAALVAAQLIVSLIIDRLGLFGLHELALSWSRLLGAALVIAGTILVTRG